MNYEENTTSNTPRDELTEMLEGMTKQELVKYARMTYGLSVTAKYSKPDLINAIKSASQKFKMNESLQVGAALDTGLKPGYADIQLHRTETTKGMKSVIVGLNGTMASLPIGKRFGCPLELVEILEHAVRLEYEQDTSVEPPELVERAVHAYPFTIFAVNQHTPESLAKAHKKRGLRRRQAPVELDFDAE
jgi:hypothetical protein